VAHLRGGCWPWVREGRDREEGKGREHPALYPEHILTESAQLRKAGNNILETDHHKTHTQKNFLIFLYSWVPPSV
jgi:hypothetical protein